MDDRKIEKMKDLEEAIQAAESFYVTEYPKLTREERIAYWATIWWSDFRFHEGIGLDGYNVFLTYDSCKEIEPNLDSLLPEIIEKARLSLDKVLAVIETLKDK